MHFRVRSITDFQLVQSFIKSSAIHFVDMTCFISYLDELGNEYSVSLSHVLIYYFTITPFYYIREIKPAKYTTILHYSTGQKYGRKAEEQNGHNERSKHAFFPLFRLDFLSNKLWSASVSFWVGHQEHWNELFCAVSAFHARRHMLLI